MTRGEREGKREEGKERGREGIEEKQVAERMEGEFRVPHANYEVDAPPPNQRL